MKDRVEEDQTDQTDIEMQGSTTNDTAEVVADVGDVSEGSGQQMEQDV
jgi:hypothetical protein